MQVTELKREAASEVELVLRPLFLSQVLLRPLCELIQALIYWSTISLGVGVCLYTDISRVVGTR